MSGSSCRNRIIGELQKNIVKGVQNTEGNNQGCSSSKEDLFVGVVDKWKTKLEPNLEKVPIGDYGCDKTKEESTKPEESNPKDGVSGDDPAPKAEGRKTKESKGRTGGEYDAFVSGLNPLGRAGRCPEAIDHNAEDGAQKQKTVGVQSPARLPTQQAEWSANGLMVAGACVQCNASGL